jgi:hypothetical protein
VRAARPGARSNVTIHPESSYPPIIRLHRRIRNMRRRSRGHPVMAAPFSAGRSAGRSVSALGPIVLRKIAQTKGPSTFFRDKCRAVTPPLVPIYTSLGVSDALAPRSRQIDVAATTGSSLPTAHQPPSTARHLVFPVTGPRRRGPSALRGNHSCWGWGRFCGPEHRFSLLVTGASIRFTGGGVLPIGERHVGGSQGTAKG